MNFACNLWLWIVQVPVQEQVCMVHITKTHRRMGNREISQSRNWKVDRQSPVCVGRTSHYFTFRYARDRPIMGGCGGLRAYLIPTCVGLRKRKTDVCRHRGNRAYIHLSILVKTTASRHAYSVRTNWSPSPAAAGTRTGPCFVCLAKVRMTWIFELSSFPSWLFLYLGKKRPRCDIDMYTGRERWWR